LAKANHGSLLPASWRTLYALTKLDDTTLEAWLADSTIANMASNGNAGGGPPFTQVRWRMVRYLSSSMLNRRIVRRPRYAGDPQTRQHQHFEADRTQSAQSRSRKRRLPQASLWDAPRG
jgi:hypothetical protein